jgi:hypothetical protein
MKLAPKVILHSPVSDEGLLNEFVEQCLRDQVSLIAIVGPDCVRLEDTIDGIIVGDGSNPDRFICTSSHPGEPLDDVLEMAELWDTEQGGGVQEVRL